MAITEKPLYYLTIHEAQKLIQSRALSPVELTRAVLDRIKAVDEKLHAYINLMSDGALKEAQTAEAEIQRGNWRGPMHGIPVAVKDQLDVDGAPARIRQHTKGVGDATAVRKLREAGAVLMGKLHMSSLPDADLPCRAIRGTPTISRADRVPVPVRRYPVGSAWVLLAKIRRVPFATLRLSAASSGSRPPTVE